MSWLLLLTWISCDHDFLQHISAQYLDLVENEYFYNKHSLVEICSSFLDLLGDVFFLVPGLLTARYHRGESLSTRSGAQQGQWLQ